MRIAIAYVLVVFPALGGVALGVYAYFSSRSGVTGTPGALLALIGAALVLFGSALAMMRVLRGSGLRVLKFLIGICTLLTAVAAYFLMQNAFAVAMVLAFIGLLITIASPNRKIS